MDLRFFSVLIVSFRLQNQEAELVLKIKVSLPPDPRILRASTATQGKTIINSTAGSRIIVFCEHRRPHKAKQSQTQGPAPESSYFTSIDGHTRKNNHNLKGRLPNPCILQHRRPHKAGAPFHLTRCLPPQEGVLSHRHRAGMVGIGRCQANQNYPREPEVTRELLWARARKHG